MNKIVIVHVGSLKEDYWRAAEAEYVKRLSAYCKTEYIEIKEEKLPENPSETQIADALKKEGMRILDKLPQRLYKAALCIEGKMVSSESLAALLSQSEAHGGCVFIIGGSFGLSNDIKNFCNAQISFSSMTFPHQLMRVLLAEQIYRGYTINSNGKYHK